MSSCTVCIIVLLESHKARNRNRAKQSIGHNFILSTQTKPNTRGYVSSDSVLKTYFSFPQLVILTSGTTRIDHRMREDYSQQSRRAYPPTSKHAAEQPHRLYRSASNSDRVHYSSNMPRVHYLPGNQPSLNPIPRRRQEQRQNQSGYSQPYHDAGAHNNIIADDDNLMPDPERLPVNRSHRYPIFEKNEQPADENCTANTGVIGHSRSFSVGRQMRQHPRGEIRLQMNGHRAARSIDRRGPPTYIPPDFKHPAPQAPITNFRVIPPYTPAPIVHRNSLPRPLSFDPLEQSLLKSRKRSKQRRNIECLGIIFFVTLLGATIGGYGFLVYRTHFWVNDALTKNDFKMPSWVHVVATFSIIVEIILIIAFVTRFKHAH